MHLLALKNILKGLLISSRNMIVHLLSMNFILHPGGQWPVSSETFFLIKHSHLLHGRLALFKNLLKIELLCLEFFCSNPSHNKKIVHIQYLRTITNIETPHVPKIILTTSFSSQPDQLLYKPNYYHTHSRLNAILKSESKGIAQKHSRSRCNMEQHSW